MNFAGKRVVYTTSKSSVVSCFALANYLNIDLQARVCSCEKTDNANDFGHNPKDKSNSQAPPVYSGECMCRLSQCHFDKSR